MTTDRNCLDAETVAAWMDGGLDPAAQAAAEAHASACERCQALLATVAKTIPAEPAAEPVGLRLWKWWLAPLAATAAAVTIWMVVPQRPMQPESRQAASTDGAVTEKPQAAPPVARDEIGAKNQQAPAGRDAEPQRSPADARRNVPAAANEAMGKLAAAKDADRAKADAAERVDQQAKREENAPAAGMRQAQAPPPAASEAAADRFREPAIGAAAAPAPPAAPAATILRNQFAAPVIVSPDPNRRWRFANGVERSEDGGRIWIPVRIAGNEEILGGASPARLVCWLVGRGGLVLLATDGTNFTRLPFPEKVDLVSVSSPEARIAIVTAADGRTFRTEDAGRNWRNP